ncbi:16S rRNA (guanine(527)-N(7))-methyltransferase RsmG [uncultured Sphingomonas sp.]|uniref:16S rRNA (guanine(527)-N(7))-methyltransferase RsmG n=1 Tax=uncultured Sphingomonas sp. TaxID=158754 RepID=UPI00259028CF|nr:16S rRNA (guanine(527)-N(7))-methyltransferase RsmG [uncultured Sphingomonas sp.]
MIATEDDARAWIAARHGDAAVDRLGRFAAIVVEEAARQNLISPSTIPHIWVRHLLDSAQLLTHADSVSGAWLDVGTGAGFPGTVIALLRQEPITLVEPRAKRAMFLSDSATALGLDHVTVVQSRVETMPASRFAIISARAVASLDDIGDMTRHVRDARTRYILPRGRSGRTDLETLRREWQGLFHVEQSLTDPESTIILGQGVTR